VEVGLLGLGAHVEPEPEVLLIGQAVHARRVTVDRELEPGLDLEVGVLPTSSLDVHHDELALRRTFDQVQAPDQRPGEESISVYSDGRIQIDNVYDGYGRDSHVATALSRKG
jgi:hypothetical protein